MNATHYHLILNHIPVFGTLFALALLIFALIRKSCELQRVALGCLVLTAVLAIPAFLTGEPTEHAIAKLPDVSKGIIEKHEEVAQAAFITLSMLGATTLAVLVLSRRKEFVPPWMTAVILVGSLIVSGLMAWTANLGGQVRRPELRWGVAAQTADSRMGITRGTSVLKGGSVALYGNRFLMPPQTSMTQRTNRPPLSNDPNRATKKPVLKQLSRSQQPAIQPAKPVSPP